jgi:hypothetical protein
LFIVVLVGGRRFLGSATAVAADGVLFSQVFEILKRDSQDSVDDLRTIISGALFGQWLKDLLT